MRLRLRRETYWIISHIKSHELSPCWGDASRLDTIVDTKETKKTNSLSRWLERCLEVQEALKMVVEWSTDLTCWRPRPCVCLLVPQGFYHDVLDVTIQGFFARDQFPSIHLFYFFPFSLRILYIPNGWSSVYFWNLSLINDNILWSTVFKDGSLSVLSWCGLQLSFCRVSRSTVLDDLNHSFV